MTYSDEQLIEALEEIDQLGAEVSEWEAHFIDGILGARLTKLTEKQRAVIEKMITQYFDW